MSNFAADKIVAGSWILEQLTLQLPDVEMAAGRRAWHEAESAWPGEEQRLWWKWLTEAIQSIGEDEFLRRATALAQDNVRDGLPLRGHLQLFGYIGTKS